MFLAKNRRFRKGRLYGFVSNLNSGTMRTGTFGLKVLENGYLTVDQIEAARKAIKQVLRKFRFTVPLIIRVVPLLSRSKKKKGIRMGGSKGGFYCFVYRARYGTILFEIQGIANYQIFEKLRRVAQKFPIRTAIIFKKN